MKKQFTIIRNGNLIKKTDIGMKNMKSTRNLDIKNTWKEIIIEEGMIKQEMT